MQISFFLFLILVPLFGSGQSIDTLMAVQQDSAFINGQINVSGEKHAFITFYVADYMLGIEREEFAEVDAGGRFEIRFFIRNTHQVNWRYGGLRTYGTLIVSPGDSLTLTVSDKAITFAGKNAAASEDFYHMRTAKEWATYHHALDTGYRLEPEAYLEFRKKHFENDLQLLNAYCETRPCSDLFKKWYATDIKVRYFRDLMAYSWKSADYGLGSPVRLTGERKEKYNASYLSQINPADSSYAMSKWYTFFLNGYSQKVERRIPPDEMRRMAHIAKLNFLLDIVGKQIPREINEVSAHKQTLERLLMKARAEDTPDSTDIKTMWKLSEQYELPLQRAMADWQIDMAINRTESIENQQARELTYLHSFVRQIESLPNLDYVYKKMFPLIRTPKYKELLTKEYNKQKEENALIDNNQQGIQIVRKDYNKSANQILSDIVKSNRNKIIIIDFWATWCAPCLNDFTRMKPIKEKLSADSVNYVYLCSQSSRDLWVKQIKKYGVKGQHYFLSDTQYSEFQKKFGLKAFPSYVIVDAERKIHKNIPSRRIRDEKEFLQLLQEIGEGYK